MGKPKKSIRISEAIFDKKYKDALDIIFFKNSVSHYFFILVKMADKDSPLKNIDELIIDTAHIKIPGRKDPIRVIHYEFDHFTNGFTLNLQNSHYPRTFITIQNEDNDIVTGKDYVLNIKSNTNIVFKENKIFDFTLNYTQTKPSNSHLKHLKTEFRGLNSVGLNITSKNFDGNIVGMTGSTLTYDCTGEIKGNIEAEYSSVVTTDNKPKTISADFQLKNCELDLKAENIDGTINVQCDENYVYPTINLKADDLASEISASNCLLKMNGNDFYGSLVNLMKTTTEIDVDTFFGGVTALAFNKIYLKADTVDITTMKANYLRIQSNNIHIEETLHAHKLDIANKDKIFGNIQARSIEMLTGEFNGGIVIQNGYGVLSSNYATGRIFADNADLNFKTPVFDGKIIANASNQINLNMMYMNGLLEVKRVKTLNIESAMKFDGKFAYDVMHFNNVGNLSIQPKQFVYIGPKPIDVKNLAPYMSK